MGELTYNKEKAAAAASLLLNKVSAAAIAARLKDKPLPSGFVLELTEQSIVDDHRINQYLAAQKEEKHEPKFTGLYDSLEDTTRAKNPLLGELYAEIQEREGLDTLIALQVKSHSKSTATAADGTTEKREVITLGQASTDGIVPTLQSKIDTSKIDNEKIKNLINSTKDEDTKFLEDYTTSATYDALYTIATQNDGSTVLDLSEVIKTSKESDDKNRSQKLTTLSRVFRCKLDATEDFIDQEIRRTANSQSGEQDDAKTHIAPHTWLEQVHLYTAIGAFACENNLQFTSISTDNKLEQRDFIHKDTGFGLKARTPVAVLTNKGGDPLVTNNTVTLFCTALTNKLEQDPFAALTKAKQYI